MTSLVLSFRSRKPTYQRSVNVFDPTRKLLKPRAPQRDTSSTP
jgi:hypothetical protein